MLSVVCDHCRRRFTLSSEDLQGYVVASLGMRYSLVLCSHCGRGNKIGRQRLLQSSRRAGLGERAPESGTSPVTGN
jgi:hypothetical protein